MAILEKIALYIILKIYKAAPRRRRRRHRHRHRRRHRRRRRRLFSYVAAAG